MKQLTYTKAIFDSKEKKAVARVLNNGWLSGGIETIKFEKELAKWWGVKHAISCNSGSCANFVALQALELPEGSKVITPAAGAFPTTVSPIIYHKLIPLFVDSDPFTFCIDLDELEKAVKANKDVKAIVFSHTLGFMPNMKKLMAIAKKYKLRVLEDTCDAMGSAQNGKKAGTFGDVATVSFYPAHQMTLGGEGGAILTNSDEIWKRCISIRDWGRDCVCQLGGKDPACGDRWKNPPFDHRYYYTNIGLNFRITEMQAAFGREQLKKVNKLIALRKRNYKLLASQMGVKFNPEFSYFAFPIFTMHKEKITSFLAKYGIETRPIFAGDIRCHPAYIKTKHESFGLLPIAKMFLEKGFFVGVGPNLSKKDILFIAKKLKESFHGVS